ncbi:DUF4175 family protein [Ekhidna sp.]|uniref:DUF4175 family protein n=1 Tax=Ekhidna sp. TaxID=2608089 RepID=UPI0035161F72
MSNSGLHIVRQKWRSRIFIKCLAWLVLILSAAVLTNWLGGFDWYWMVGFGAIGLILIGLELRRLPIQIDLIRLVNEQYAPAEYSTDLLFQHPKSELQTLQQSRVDSQLKQQLPSFHYPVRWNDLLVVGLLLMLTLTGFSFINSQSRASFDNTNSNSLAESEMVVIEDTVFIARNRLSVNPPRYTGLPNRTYETMNIDVPEQSLIQWNLIFNGTPKAVWMGINGGDSLPVSSVNENYQLKFKALKSTLYTINYLDDKDRLISSPYYEMNVIADEAPEIVVNGIPSFQRMDYRKNISIDMNVTIADDYGLTDGYVVATITKGSGESVKFREQRIAIPGGVRGKKVIRPVSFDLDKLNMEPGNELYFYVTAFDNKLPKSQQSRTDTYFVVLKDTAEVEFSLQGALGVDLMPDFFRSQLQIIIDTKKLIEEKGQISEYDFNFESNALGYDQKQLRLKYGQFIGEEEDSGLEIEDEPIEPGTDGDDVLSEFGHDTDAENEEGQWMDRGTESDHDHEDHQEEESLLEQFMHNHEDEETATFYTQSLKSKLRAALNEMWDAELYLRLYKPKESLPYQLKAQELLKEIRNHARIYVQRIGFDPPPVNVDESRLTGELKELNDQPFEASIDKEQSYPAIRKAIQTIDQFKMGTWKWSDDNKSILKAAGDELAGLAIENPGKYLSSLNELKSILDKDQLTESDYRNLFELQKVLEQALPIEKTLPPSEVRSGDAYTDAFVESLVNSNGQ